MIIKGFIKEVLGSREWTNKDGEKRKSVKMVLGIPYVSKDGQEHEDELLGELNYGNPDYLEGIQKACDAQEKCEFQVGFSLGNWNGKKIQNIRVYSLTKMIG